MPQRLSSQMQGGRGPAALIVPPRTLFHLIDPGHLDRFQNLFAAVLRVVVETVKGEHPVAEIGEAHQLRIGVGMRIAQRNRDLARVGPFHCENSLFGKVRRLPSLPYLPSLA